MLYKIMGILILCSGIVGYYLFTQNTIQKLNASLIKTEIAYKQTLAVVTELKNQKTQQNKQINHLIKEMNLAQKDKDKFQRLIQKHNLTKISAKKPGLIEKRINNASKEIFNDFGDITTY